MTLRINKEAGKGSGRRATQDDSAYRNNYDAIFSKKKAEVPFVPALPSLPSLPDTVVDCIEEYQKETDTDK